LKPGDTISEGQGLRAWKRGARSPVTFTLQKRVRGEAKGRTFTLGNWPDVSIDDARTKASRFRKLCGDGVNPETVEREAFAAQSASQTTLRQYTERFLAQPAPRTGRMRRPNTIRDYWSTLNVVVPHLLDTAIRNISPGQIEKAYHAARDQGAVEFAKLFHRSMQAIVNDAMKTTAPDGKPFITRDPLENISKFPKVARRREAYLTAREVRIAIRAGFDRLFRDRAVDFGLVTQNNAMLVAVYTGLRISEVLSLKVSDVHRIGSSWLGDEVRQPFLSVRVGKKNPASGELTTVSHYLPLVPTLDMIVTMQMLCRAVWLSKREGRWDTDYLFPSPRKAGMRLAGLTPSKTFGCRHWKQTAMATTSSKRKRATRKVRSQRIGYVTPSRRWPPVWGSATRSRGGFISKRLPPHSRQSLATINGQATRNLPKTSPRSSSQS
jgi:integrase